MAGTLAGAAKARAALEAKKAQRRAEARAALEAEAKAAKLAAQGSPAGSQQPVTVEQQPAAAVHQTSSVIESVHQSATGVATEGQSQSVGLLPTVPTAAPAVVENVPPGQTDTANIIATGAQDAARKVIRLLSSPKAPAAVQLNAAIWLLEANGHGGKALERQQRAAIPRLSMEQAALLLAAVVRHREGAEPRTIEGERVQSAQLGETKP